MVSDTRELEKFLREELELPREVTSFTLEFDADGYMRLKYRQGPPSIHKKRRS